MPLTTIKYRGWTALRLATRALELIAPVDFGPRILSLRPLGRGRSGSGRGDNVFFEFPGPDHGTLGSHGCKLYGGHRLWHAPEDRVRTYQPDNDPVQVRLLLEGRGFALTQATEKLTGIQKSIGVEAVNDRTVKVTHTLANRGRRPVEFAPWALTMLRGGGYGVAPFPPKGSHSQELLPRYSIVPWTYTDLALPCWDLHRNFIGIDTSKARESQKLGLTSYPGWSAYWHRGVTFVKQGPALQAGRIYPDLGCCIETYTNGGVIELETLGPLGPVAPGRRVRHVEYWGILDGLPKPCTDRVFAERLRPAVKTWADRI